jgi:hypothetical protein
MVVVFINFEFSEEEASETPASLSHEISFSPLHPTPAAFSAGNSLINNV